MDQQDSGIYFLLVYLKAGVTLIIRHTEHALPRGWYVYIGSAQRYLSRRLARHHRARKKRHWHIDYLLEHARIVESRILPGFTRDDESRCARVWCACADRVPVPKFGASDSQAPAHLVWFRSRIRATASPLWNQAEKSGILLT